MSGCDKVFKHFSSPPHSTSRQTSSPGLNQIQKKILNAAKYPNNYLLLDLISLFKIELGFGAKMHYRAGVSPPILMMKNVSQRAAKLNYERIEAVMLLKYFWFADFKGLARPIQSFFNVSAMEQNLKRISINLLMTRRRSGEKLVRPTNEELWVSLRF